MNLSALKIAAYGLAYALLRVHWFVFRPKTRGSYVALWSNDRLLVVRNSYKRVWTLPCGGIHRGESAVHAASRELMEETGIDLPAERLAYVGRYESRVEHKRDQIELYEVILDYQPVTYVDGVEVVQACFLSRDEVLALPLFPTVREYVQNRR